MVGFKGAGEETTLPEMSAAVLVAVLFPRVLRVRLTERERQRFRASWNRDEMNVIGHQAPSEDTDVLAARVFVKHLEVADSVLFGEENVLPIVAALRNVMRHARDHETRSAGHTR
jgi:hypothetical protein